MKLRLTFKNTVINFTNKKIGIIGSSGSGKSSLFKHIVRISHLKVYENVDLFLNNDLLDIKKIAYQCQTPIFFQGFSVKENLQISKTIKMDYALDLLEKFNCLHLLDQKDNLSGGEQQVLDFIRLVASDFHLFLFDEPNSALDRKKSQVMQKVIKEKDKFMFIISHDLDFIKNTCDYFIFLDNFLIKEHGIDILQNPKTMELKKLLN